MRTAELKSNIIELINQINDNSKLQAILTLLTGNQTNNKSDWWDGLSDIEKEFVEKGLTDYKNRDVLTSQEVKIKLAEKFPNLRFK